MGRPPARQLLLEAGYDEQRVVDADRQADHDHHQRDEEDELELLAYHGNGCQGQDDGHHGQAQREQGGHHRA